MSDIPSDLAEPVPEPTGPSEPVATPQASTDAGSLVFTPQDDAPASLVGLPELKEPAPVAASGEVVVGVDEPWNVGNFDPSIEGCPAISRLGTAIPAQFVDQVISIGATNGVTIAKR